MIFAKFQSLTHKIDTMVIRDIGVVSENGK